LAADLARAATLSTGEVAPARTAPGLEWFGEVGAAAGYAVVASWSGTGPEKIDVIFADRTRTTALTGTHRPARRPSADPSAHANTPLGSRGGISIPRLRADLAAVLPDYLVPAAIVVLDDLPLNPNGKVDTAALPAPQARTTRAQRPRTTTESALCTVFAEVLGLAEVGVEDSFFALGGHSLLATRLVSRVAAELDINLTARAVFDNPTVAGLASAVADAGGSRPRLLPRHRPRPLPTSYAQRRLWFIHQLEGPSVTYHMGAALRLTGALDLAALRAAFADVVARHESLRTVFPEQDGEPVQLVQPHAQAPVRVRPVTEAALPGELAAAAGEGFDLIAEPPIRATLFQLGPHESVLLIVLHHIAGDGWSVHPLTRDLVRAYRARARGAAPEVEPLPVQYADYALWQREMLGSEDDPESVLARELAYWTERLAGLAPELELGADRPRPAVAQHRGGTVHFTVETAVVDELERLAHAANASLFMFLHTGAAALLTRLGAGTDVPIGTPVAGRADSALDDLVGLFVNTLVLRADTGGDPTFRELLERIRATDLEAFDHQDVPFERLVEALNPDRSMARHPLFQVALAFEEGAAEPPGFPGLEVEAEPVPTGTSRFDLTFALSRRGPGGELRGGLEYSRELFDPDTAERIASRFERLLRAAARDPDR
ncbi:MAG: non-ribosomal peptide synthetase, partial [Saccharopolyspora sp.]|uniref:condensation domain-containing protein n=1 Tax=Saccharopolyspora sp. TaxID=33915 RepID=UPI0025F9E7EE